MVEDRNPAEDMIDISTSVLHENASYDKDVMEIKLTDSVVSSDYGGNFVKDVCIDDRHLKSSEGEIVEDKSSSNFGCPTDANSDPIHRRKNKATKSAHKLKPETILHVHFALNGNNKKQNSSCEEHDLEENVTATKTAADVSEKKVSLEDLLRLESEEESQYKGTIITKNSENYIPPPLHGEAAGPVFVNGCHEFEAIASPTSDLDNTGITMKDKANGCSATPSAEHDVTPSLDARESNQVNRYNHVVDHGILEAEVTCKPECSISAIADAALTEPICDSEKTEPRASAPSSTSSDIQSSQNDKNESLPSEAIIDAMDETAVPSSSSAEELSGANRENHEHDFNHCDQENRVNTMNIDAVSSTSTHVQKDNTDDQAVPDSGKVTSRAGNGHLFEPDLYGPSIMAATVSNSGHIAYSGNISIRSDSSNTSSRSFAFPILQREWMVSSPVRMAKGERRRIRRRRSWRKGLLCCQF